MSEFKSNECYQITFGFSSHLNAIVPNMKMMLARSIKFFVRNCQEVTGTAPHLCFFPTIDFIIAPKTSLRKFAT